MRTFIVIALAVTGCGAPLDQEDLLETETGEDALAGSMTVRTTARCQSPKWQKSFVIDATNTLCFAADVASGPGTHKVVFEVMEPQGGVYQRTESSCTGADRVVASMPVAGTWIQQFAMTGKWKVMVFVDDAPAAAGRTGFSLR